MSPRNFKTAFSKNDSKDHRIQHHRTVFDRCEWTCYLLDYGKPKDSFQTLTASL
jgi:hypothetical protein